MRIGAVLYVYQGEWGLPSIDFECLQCLCLIKFTNCPVQIESNGNPLRSGGGKLPYLRIGNEKYVGYKKIKKLLDKEGYAIDVNLDPNAKELSSVYTNWIFNNLHAYYHYFMFGEPTNYDTVTRALYASRTPFPFNFYYPATYHKEALDVLSVMGDFDIRDKIENHEVELIVANAKQCVNMLSQKLGKKAWFFGYICSECDAIVYSYLSVLFRISLPNNPLQNHIKGCLNLAVFINRVTVDIFRNEGFTSANLLKTVPSDPFLTPGERQLMKSKNKTKALAGIGAVLAMGIFAVWRGVYQQFSPFKMRYENFDYDDDLVDRAETQ